MSYSLSIVFPMHDAALRFISRHTTAVKTRATCHLTDSIVTWGRAAPGTASERNPRRIRRGLSTASSGRTRGDPWQNRVATVRSLFFNDFHDGGKEEQAQLGHRDAKRTGTYGERAAHSKSFTPARVGPIGRLNRPIYDCRRDMPTV